MARDRRFLNLGAGGSAESFAVDEIPGGPGQLGGVHLDGINRYQLVQVVDAAAAATEIVFWKSYTGQYKATRTLANSSRNETAGIVTTAVTANQYTLVKQGGLTNVAATAAVVFARGDFVVPDTGVASAANVAVLANATYQANRAVKEIGIAQAAQAGGVVSTFLTIEPI